MFLRLGFILLPKFVLVFLSPDQATDIKGVEDCDQPMPPVLPTRAKALADAILRKVDLIVSWKVVHRVPDLLRYLISALVLNARQNHEW